MNQQTLAFFPTFAKKKNNDNIKKSKLMKHLFFLDRFALPDGSTYQFICPGTEY